MLFKHSESLSTRVHDLCLFRDQVRNTTRVRPKVGKNQMLPDHASLEVFTRLVVSAGGCIWVVLTILGT